MLHYGNVAFAVFIECRDDGGFQFRIKIFGVRRIVDRDIGSGFAMMRLADGPTGDAFDVPFGPPAIEDTQAGDAVESGLHATGAAGFEWILRRVQPQIHSGGEVAAEIHVVVIEKNNGDGFFQGFFRLVNVLDDFLATGIVRVSLAGEDDLEMADVFGNLTETVEIAQNQFGAFVGGGATSETDGEIFGIEFQSGLVANVFEKRVL